MNFVGRKAISTVLCVIIMLMSLSVCVSAQESATVENTLKVLHSDATQLICVSKYGDRINYPENSVEGILSASEKGADMVLVSVKKTSDNELVLMTDSSLVRMCVDKDGNAVNKDISQVGFYELKSYTLKNGRGGSNEKATAYEIPTLLEALQAVNGKTIIAIENAWEYKDEIYGILTENGMLNSCVLVAQADKKELSSWLSGKAAMPLVFSKYVGTVVWNSRSYIKKTVKSGAVGVMLGCSNAYSMTFNKNTVSKTDGKIRAVIDMTDPQMCGKRSDIPLYWDDVTSRGFSVIITDNTEQFREYSSRTENARQRLYTQLEKAGELDITRCSTYTANEIKSKISESKKICEESVCANTLEKQYTELSKAFAALDDNAVGNKHSRTVTKGRIIAAICVVICLVVMELAFEYYRNKSIKLRKVGRKLYGKKKKK